MLGFLPRQSLVVQVGRDLSVAVLARQLRQCLPGYSVQPAVTARLNRSLACMQVEWTESVVCVLTPRSLIPHPVWSTAVFTYPLSLVPREGSAHCAGFTPLPTRILTASRRFFAIAICTAATEQQQQQRAHNQMARRQA